MPGVLTAWIGFAGRRRGIPQELIDLALKAAEGYSPQMIELSADPANWGPGKIVSLGLRKRGIDVTDKAAVDTFLAEVNRSGGIDVLADSLVE